MSEPSQIWLLICAYKYWIIAPLACIEGPMVAIIAGALVARGLFDVEVIFALLLLGDIIPDFGCYLVGYCAWRGRMFRRPAETLRTGRATKAAVGVLLIGVGNWLCRRSIVFSERRC